MFKNRMKSWMSPIVFLFVLLLCVDGVCAQKTEQAIGLTPEERAWLAAHPIIRFSGDPAYLPLEAFSTDGKYIGIFADILDLLESRLDVRFERVPVSTWSEAVRMAEAGEVDFLSESTQSGRDKLFTNPHTQISVVIIGRKGTPALSSPAELNGRKVAVVKGYKVHTPFREANPEINFVEVGSTRDGLLMVTTGGVDAFISTPLTASYLMSELGLENLSIIGYTGAIIKLGFGVRRNAPQLVSILNRALSTITELEKLAFRVKWSANKFEPPQVQLTPEEGAWLKAHPDIRLVFPKGHEPSMMKDDEGRFTGVMADYWNLLSNRLGIDVKFELVPMSELPKLIKNKEVEGMLFASPKLIEAFDLVGAGPVIQSYAVIYGRQTKAPFQFPQDLFDKKVAILKGYDHTDHAVSPIRGKADLIEVVSPLEGLKATHRKKVDFFIGSIGNNYTVNKYLLFGIGPIHVFWGNPYTLVPAVRPDLPELASILNKGTDLVSKEEFNAIVGKWTQVRQLKYTIDLTPEERVWLDEHPVITLGGGIFPPLDDFNDVKDRPEGIGPDYTELIGDLLGIKFKYISDDWAKILKMAEEKKIDGIRIMLRNKEREAYLNFTQSQTSVQYAIFVQKQSGQPRTLKDLSRKKVGVMGDTYSHSYLREHYPDIEVVPFKRIDDALFALIGGELDAVVASLTVAGIAADRLFITNLNVAATLTEMDTRLQIGVRKDWPEFVTILNKAIDAITPEQHREIKRKWITFDPEDLIEPLKLSEKEKNWLAQGHTVRVRVANAEPYIFVRDGKPQGIAIDLLDLIHQHSGVKFRYIMDSPSFAEDLEKIAQHEGPDLISTIMKTPERETFLLFTKNYSISPRFIFTRQDSEFIRGMDDLSNKTVAVVNSFAVHKYLKKNHPKINLLVYRNVEDSLKAVSSGKAFAFIGDIKFAPIMITRLGLHNLKVAAPSSLPDHVQAMATRNDWPELRNIINKALDAIPLEEKTAIINKWSSVKFDYGIRPVDVLKWGLGFGGGAFLIAVLFVFWNKSLKKQVDVRTKELDSINQSLEAEVAERTKAENALRESRDYLENLMDSIGDAIFLVKMPEREVEWVNDSFNVLGYEAVDCIGMSTEFLYTSRESFIAFAEIMAHAISEGKDIVHLEFNLKKKNGEVFPADITLSFYRVNGDVRSITAIVRDISKRKQREKQITDYQGRLKALASQLTVTEESERRSIAADLHDQIGQTLALARIQLAAVRKSASDDGLTAQIDELSESMRQAAQDTQNLVFDLSSPSMNELGLGAAISEWLEEKIEKRHGLKTEFIDDGHRKPINDDERAIMFRNVRELLTNVVKHARAKQVSVLLEYADASLRIVVQDDGIGFDYRSVSQEGSTEGGFGLFSIKERMTDLGGALEIESESGKGCKVILTTPLNIKDGEARD